MGEIHAIATTQQKLDFYKPPSAMKFVTEKKYLKGMKLLDIESSQDEALVSLEFAARLGHAKAQIQLYHIYGDRTRALEWLTFAAEKGDTEAQYLLSCHIRKQLPGEHSNETNETNETATSWLTLLMNAACKGHADAQRELAICYLNGVGVLKCDTQGCSLLTKSAQQGNKEAQYLLGLLHLEGKAGDIESEKLRFEAASHWLLKASAQNHASAQFKLATLYVRYASCQTSGSLKEGVQLYTKSAENYNEAAMWVLIDIYNNGKFGEPKCLKKSFMWYEKLANLGDSKAQYELGVRFKLGDGCSQCNVKAFEWFTISFSNGNKDALSAVAHCYERGCGVEKSLIQASRLQKIAAEFERATKTNGVAYVRFKN